MAEVRKASDTRLNRDVAVKQLRIDLASDQTFQERFRREAQSAAGLNHPNIVAVYDTGKETDLPSGVSVPYIVMELVHGYTLRELLRTGRKIQPVKALEFAAGVLDALDYSHKAGIVHRDIKPANVMLTPSGQVKVMDFGIARAVSDTSSTMTQTAAVIGTASYFSPEQARGEAVDARSDIYSTGCLLYELLVGRPPFVGDSPVSVAYQHVQEPPVAPSRLDPVITPSMDSVVLRALAKDPDARYQTAAAMRADITRILNGQDLVGGSVPTAPLPTFVAAGVPVAAAAAVPAATAALPSAARAIEDPTGPSRAVVEDDDAGDPPRRFLGLWIFMIVLALVSAAVGLFLLFGNPDGGQVWVDVPNVTDRKPEEATALLEEKNLKAKIHPVEGPDDNSVGRVINQNPVTGSKVQPGWEVILDVNIGPTKAEIPSGLNGRNKDDVVRDLAGGFGFTNVEAQVDPKEPLTAQKDEVTSIAPEPGSLVTLDTPIIVYYASGMSEVPNIMNITKESAANMLKNAGFTKELKCTTQASNATTGHVISVTPNVGDIVERTTAVKCVIAKEMPVVIDPPNSPSGSPSPNSSASEPTQEPG
jgi:serine/threonine-protein kinase